MAEQNADNFSTDAGAGRAENAQPAGDAAQESRVISSEAEAAEAALNTAEGAARRIADEAEKLDVPTAVNLPEFEMDALTGNGAQSVDLLSDVALNVTIELGRTKMYVEDVLRLNPNSIVELDKAAGDP